jgi:hypothetical protein
MVVLAALIVVFGIFATIPLQVIVPAVEAISNIIPWG